MVNILVVYYVLSMYSELTSETCNFYSHIKHKFSCFNLFMCLMFTKETPVLKIKTSFCGIETSVTIEYKYGNRVPKAKIWRKPDSFELVYTKL